MAALTASHDTEFRTCPVTALKVDLTAEKLIKINAIESLKLQTTKIKLTEVNSRLNSKRNNVHQMAVFITY